MAPIVNRFLPVFRDAGKATGLVTTTEITHATPAGFAANVEIADNGERHCLQYLEREVDILLGGGNNHYDPEIREDELDLYESTARRATLWPKPKKN
jgi:alkaline phosphatase